MPLIERPYNFSYSKNDIRYVWQLSALDRAGLFLQVKLKYKALADPTYTELYTFEFKPTSTGYVYFYLQNYLDSLLNYVMPDITQLITAADKQALKFYVEFREVTDDDADPDWNISESDYERICIKGGIEKNKFDRNNIFVNYLETQKPFLTWQPSFRFVFYNENVFLSFINPTPGTAIRLIIACKAIASGIQYFIFDFNGAATLYHVNVGPAFLFANNLFSIGNMHYYEISITNADSTVTLINPYRYFIEYRSAYKFYDLVYFNSLGGVDSVRVLGETAVTVSKDYDETEGGFKVDWDDPVHAHENSQTNMQLQRQYKGNIGYLRNRTKKEQEAFIEFLATQKIYQLIDNRWIPILGLQKSVDLGTNEDTKHSFPIEWSLSEKDEVFTPEYKNFGDGISTAVCYPVTIEGELPAGTVGVPYNASLDITSGSLPILSVTSSNLPAGLLVSYNSGTNQIDISGTPTATFTGNLQLTIINCTVTNRNVAFTVNAACTPITLSRTLPNGTVGTAYSASLDITGGTLPVSSVTSSNLPAGLSVSYNSGTHKIDFSGTPTEAFSGAVHLTITNCTTANIDINLTIGEQGNTTIINDTADVEIEDVLLTSICFPYTNSPWGPGESGTATMPYETSHEIGVRFGSIPLHSVSIRLSINGVLQEIKVETPTSMVMYTDNVYTIHAGDTVEIIVY